MKRNEEIVQLAYEIMVDLSENRLPLHYVLLKASRLSTLVNIPGNVTLFQNWSKEAELNSFIVNTYNNSISATRDSDFAYSSNNPGLWTLPPTQGNGYERSLLRSEAKKTIENIAHYRAQVYTFALNIYQKWQFGNIAESIFERKRKKVDPVLQGFFPDIHQRLNSIEQNLKSTNQEDWKNAVVSCRTLIMEIADLLNPPKTDDEKSKYINRLKDFVSTKEESEIRKKLVGNYIVELQNRIELVSDLTQGPAHKDRPIIDYAENVVLMTYLLIADLLEFRNLPVKNTNKESKLIRTKRKLK